MHISFLPKMMFVLDLTFADVTFTVVDWYIEDCCTCTFLFFYKLSTYLPSRELIYSFQLVNVKEMSDVFKT